ncbi:MAG: DUF1559 domain-containing protein, partial [Planctomycetota bacterium]
CLLARRLRSLCRSAPADTGDQPQSAAETGEELDPNDDRNHLTSVVDRRPDAPLSPEERQQRATKNLYRIAEALTAYVKEKEHWPSPLIRNGAGIETLSWRVELLPYLGYNKLYEKFDLDMPWNSIENKKLLKYIPDVFVSPERFDDKTNFMAPVSNGYFWDRDGRKIAEDAEDGLENTIVLVEVSNDYAVPWTKPTDLNVALIKNRAPLNGPRPDGNVALWGYFLPTLIDRSVNQLQLHNAFSYEAGDGQLASIIHRNLPLGEEVDDVGIAAMETMEQSLNTTEALPAPSDVVVLQPTLVEVQEIQRLAVPKRLTLQQSQKELRGIYADKLKEAKRSEEKSTLAREILVESSSMESDPTGAYVLQEAAIKLASDAGSVDIVIQAIDQRVTMFEVDAYSENVRHLVRYCNPDKQEAVVLTRTDTSKLLQRGLRVVHAGVVINRRMPCTSMLL